MNITLYRNFSKKKNSTKRPTVGVTLNCRFKNDTSYENPTFIIHSPNFDYNYAKWGDHYYFIDDIIVGNNDIYEVRCSQDVLATFKTEILNSEQYVLRNENTLNTAISEDRYPISSQTDFESEVVNLYGTTGALDSGYYVLGVVNGDGNTSAGLSYYVMDTENFLKFKRLLYDSDSYGLLTYKSVFNPVQYITSIKWYSYKPPADYRTPYLGIQLGWYTFGADASEGITFEHYKLTQAAWHTRNVEVNFPRHPQIEEYGRQVELKPYTSYYAYSNAFGDFEIPAEEVYRAGGDNFAFSMDVDYTTGDAVLSLIRRIVTGHETYKEVRILQRTGNIAMSIPLNQLSNSPLQATISGITSAVGTVASIYSGNAVGAISSATSGIGSVTNALTPKLATTGTKTSGLSANGAVKITATFRYSVNRNPQLYGNPFCRTVQLSTLSGYTLCGNASIDINSLGGDKDEINAYLNGGFYIE